MWNSITQTKSTFDKSKGSHRKYRHEDYKHSLIIPVHGETLGRGLQKKIMKDGGIEPEDL